MKVRILVEQRADGNREYIASGAEVDLPNDEAVAMIGRGDAEPIAVKSATRAEKRPGAKRNEESR